MGERLPPASVSPSVTVAPCPAGWLDSSREGEARAERAMKANQPLSEPFVPT